MLRYLSIQNLAIIEQLEIDFTNGFTALTGETGAGKSILIDALNLALGSRSDLSLIRQGEEKCEISAIFDISQNRVVSEWLKQQELDCSECIIRRQLQLNGSTKAMINGQPVGQKSLRELGDLLVNIHSQHAHYALTQQNTQRQILDDYGNHYLLIKKLNSIYAVYQKLCQEYQEIQQLNSTQDKVDLLTFQLTEIQQFKPGADEYEQLNQQHLLLSNTEAVKSDCQAALSALSSVEGVDSNTQQLIDVALNALRRYRENYPQLKRATELLEDAQTYVNEAIDEIQHLHSIDDDELSAGQTLNDLDRRLSQWHELARKHNIPAQELYNLSLQLEENLKKLQGLSEHLQQLEGKINEQKSQWKKIADELTKKRKENAIHLQLSITAYLQQLQMYKARFEIEITPLFDASAMKPTLNGQDLVTFMFSANVDIVPRELSKIASGGELSRVALSIAVANAKNATIPTLIFDEVDVGIGGATAEIVGNLLHQLGKKQQILSITHQAQVAAQANEHLLIQKSTQEDKTKTQVTPLEKPQRVEEIARMIGGVTITDTTRKHAQELLELN